MIKDKFLRLFFIPFLGIIIPFLSGIVTYSFYSIFELIAIHLYFILLSFSIWFGSSWIHKKIRFVFKNFKNPIIKVFSVSLIGGLFGAAISGMFSIAWFKMSGENFNWPPVFKCIAFSTLAVVLFTLIYEILFLGNQRTLYTKIVGQLDWERSKAEMAVLKNELEPHFIFNSLNTLSWLILNGLCSSNKCNTCF